VDFFDVGTVNVRIDLRGSDVRMSEHFLDGTQVCTALQQVRGK
jgi:hypothetical protein